MKRLLAASVVSVTLLSACVSPLGRSESPDQAVGMAAKKMQDVKTARFDLSSTAQMQLPPALAQALTKQGGGQVPQGLTLDSLTVEVKGNGETRFPDQLHSSFQIHAGGLSVATEEYVVGAKIYVKDPISGKWSVVSIPDQLTSQFNQLDPLSASELLNAYVEIKDLGDTKLGDVAVHHYRLVPDKAKLADNLDKSPGLQNPQVKAAFRQALDRATFVAEVWIGKDDHLLRRVISDGDASIDVNQMFSSFAAQAPPSGRPGTTPPPGVATGLPPGSDLRVKFHAVLDFHDFNGPVTITPPNVSG